MELWGGDIGEKLKRRVEGFRSSDCHHREHEKTPLHRFHLKRQPCYDHSKGGRGVEPGIVLRFEHGPDPGKGKGEAPNTG